jgi:hypothetical protein
MNIVSRVLHSGLRSKLFILRLYEDTMFTAEFGVVYR